MMKDGLAFSAYIGDKMLVMDANLAEFDCFPARSQG